MDQETSMEKYVKAKDDLLIAHMHRRQMYLSCCCFGEYELGTELAVREGDRTIKAGIGQTIVPVVAFVGASLEGQRIGNTSDNPSSTEH
jgi:hypothetical protein